MKSTSTLKMNRFQFAATIFGALAIAVLAPAAAHAQPVGSVGAGGGCHYTDKDGYDIPIDDGQGVIVDGKTVTCNGGTITVSAAPSRNVGPKKPIVNQTPQKLSVLNRSVATTTTP